MGTSKKKTWLPGKIPADVASIKPQAHLILLFFPSIHFNKSLKLKTSDLTFSLGMPGSTLHSLSPGVVQFPFLSNLARVCLSPSLTSLQLQLRAKLTEPGEGASRGDCGMGCPSTGWLGILGRREGSFLSRWNRPVPYVCSYFVFQET